MKILCFGDSNTYGFDPRDVFGGRYDASHRWPELLARASGWEVINEGVNGRQIPRNPYALRLLKEHAPVDMFLVMLGTNDLLQGSPAEEAACRMEQFLLPLLPHCPSIVLIAPPPLQRGAWVDSEELVERSRLLIGKYRDLAKALNIPFADASRWNIPLAFDGVHFTEEGNRLFAARLMEFFR